MISEDFSLSGPADVDVSTGAGSVFIESGAPESAEVRIDTSRPEDWRVSCTGDRLTVEHIPRGWAGRGRATIRILVPERSSLRATTASADVRVAVALERGTVSTASGDVRIGEAEWLSVKTASGEVRVGAVGRDLEVKSASGDVWVERIDGDASITTASGDALVDEAHGAFAGSSASGDIRIRRYLGDDLEANTMSGDIDFGLPEGINVRFQATTLSGDVSLPQRRTGDSGDASRSVAVKAKSVSGDITVTRI